MSWLLSATIASIVGAFFVVRLFEYLAAGLVGSVASTAKASLFVSVWTAITTGSGMRGFKKIVRGLRQRTGPLPKDKQLQ